MHIEALAALADKPTADQVADALAAEAGRIAAAMLTIAAKHGREDYTGYVDADAMAARLSRMVCIELHKRQGCEFADVLKSLHDLHDAERRACMGLNVSAFEDAVYAVAADFEAITEELHHRAAQYGREAA